MRNWCWLFSGLLALSGCQAAGSLDEGPALSGRMWIIAAEGLADAGLAYAGFRRQAGLEVDLITTTEIQAAWPDLDLVEAITRQVPELDWDPAGGLEPYLLLLGDADDTRRDALDRVPTAMGRGSGPDGSWWELGDAPYGDFDADGIPDLSIGRLPFREPTQIEAYQARLQVHEQTYTPGRHNLTLSAFAGEGGFGPEIDGLLELAAGWVFDEMSYDFDMSMTYASPNSSYYLPPGQWDAEYAERYQVGAVLMPYVGHTLGQAACCGERPPARRGLLAFFSCGDGSFQAGGDFDPYQSLAEQVLLEANGPVASLAATSESHPYGNAILPRELGYAILDLREPTYGRALRTAKYNMVHRIDDLRRSIDAASEPYASEPLEQLIASHIVLYNLLGDPSAPVRLPPAEVRFDPPAAGLVPGQTMRISGQVRGSAARGAPVDGRIQVSLEVRRTTICHELMPRDPSDSDLATCQANHAAANDKVLFWVEAEVVAGRFELDLPVPADLPEATYYLKGFAFDERVDAIGSRPVILAR